MQSFNLIALGYAVHTLGSIILVGSLLFVEIAYLPPVADVRNSNTRMKLRLEVLGLALRWAWLGVLLIYSSGLWGISGTNLSTLPPYVAWMTGLSVPLLLLLLVGQLVLLPEARHALGVKQIKAAHRWYLWLRALMLAALVLALGTLLLGASGAAFLT